MNYVLSVDYGTVSVQTGFDSIVMAERARRRALALGVVGAVITTNRPQAIANCFGPAFGGARCA